MRSIKMKLRAAACIAILCLTLTPPAQAQLTVGTGGSVDLGGGSANLGCTDLVVNGAMHIGNATLASVRNVDFAGTLDGGSGSLLFSGDWNPGGNFLAGTGTVTNQDGCSISTSRIGGNGNFYTFIAIATTPRRLVFASGTTQTIVHELGLVGHAGALLTLRSDTQGQFASLALANGAAQNIGYVDVADNKAIGQPLAPGTPAQYNSIDSGNTQGWFSKFVDPVAKVVPTPTLSIWGLLILAALSVGIGLRRRLC